ncbi:unnamed protein product [Dicrocoelium dendriticum]|nr:unnamed protein product [Dicrocoelium dendriticum]
MATCNDDEVLSHRDTVSCNGILFVNPPELYFTSAFSGPTENRQKTMPPRTEMDSAHMVTSLEDIHDLDECIAPELPTKTAVLTNESPPNHCHPSAIFNLSALKDSPHGEIDNDDNNSYESGSLISSHDDQSDLFVRRSLYRQRLEACSERLKNLRAKSAALLARLVALNPPRLDNPSADGTPSTISRILTEDETESSTDDEACSPAMSSLEEQWLCTRAVTYSYWYWLQSEIRRSKQILRNLRLTKASYRKWKSEFPVQPTFDDASCSRVNPFLKHLSKRHSFHDLGSPNCEQLLRKLSSSSTEASMRCSCIPGHTGPCILCCGATSTVTLPSVEPQSADLLHCARPLSGCIHHKLSLPGDIPLSLRLESRLAAPTGTVFHEHKTTAHLVDSTQKPTCIRFLTKNHHTFDSLEPRTNHVSSVIRSNHSKDDALPYPLFGNAPTARLKLRPVRSGTRSSRFCTKSSNGASALRRVRSNIIPS